LACQRGHRADLTHHQRGHQFVRANAVDVIFIIDFEYFTDMIESVGSIVSE